MSKDISTLRREQTESTIKKLEEAIDDCTLTDINIINESFGLGRYGSGITDKDVKRLYDLGEKFRKTCDCYTRR